jgi:PAS domain-containing protein
VAAHIRHSSSAILDGEEDCLLAIESAGVGTWRWDLATNTIILSSRSRELIGAPCESVNYSEFLARLHPDDRVITDRSLRQRCAPGEEHDLDFRTLPTDGIYRALASDAGTCLYK